MFPLFTLVYYSRSRRVEFDMRKPQCFYASTIWAFNPKIYIIAIGLFCGCRMRVLSFHFGCVIFLERMGMVVGRLVVRRMLSRD